MSAPYEPSRLCRANRGRKSRKGSARERILANAIASLDDIGPGLNKAQLMVMAVALKRASDIPPWRR